jgi:hypothetical protein
MTTKADFTEDEWKTVIEGPPAAGVMVAAASRGGTFRESFSMAKAYTEARKNHGASPLLDELAATKPKVDRSHAHSADELKQASLKHISDALAIVDAKADATEAQEYKKFIAGLALRVAEAHSEDGQKVSPGEQAAIDEITAALGL